MFLQLTRSHGEDAGEREQCSLPAVHAASELLHVDIEDCGAPVATTARHPVTSPPPATLPARAEKVTAAGLGVLGASELVSADQCSTFGSSVLSPAEQYSSLWPDCLFLAGRHHGHTSPDSTMPWDGSPEEGLVLTESTGVSTDNSGATHCKHVLTGTVLDVENPDSPGADHTDAGQLADQAAEGTDDDPDRRGIVRAGKEDNPVRVSHLATNCVGDGGEDNFVCMISQPATTDCASNAVGDGGEDNFVCMTSQPATTDCASRIRTESDLLQLEQDMDVDEVDEVLGDRGNASDSDGCGDGDSGCEDDAGDRSDTDDTEAERSSPGVSSDLLGRPKDSDTSLGQCVVTCSLPSCVVSSSTSPSGSGSSDDVTNTNNISSKITTTDVETTTATTTSTAASRRRHSASPAQHVVERKKKNTRPSDGDSVLRQQHPQCSVYKCNEATERFLSLIHI